MDDIRATILRLAGQAGPAKSICPSEVARAMAPEDAWRPLMGPVRAEAVKLAQEGRLEILRHGKPLPDPATPRGVIRLRIVRPG